MACEHYVSDESAIWGRLELKEGKSAYWENVERPTLLFVLSGTLRVSTANVINRNAPSGQMFLVASGDNFYGTAMTDCVLMRCSFMREVTLCNKFSIEHLRKFVDPDRLSPGQDLALLPIRGLLLRELAIIGDALATGLACLHFQQMKQEILFMELRAFYSREELATLFTPILGPDNDFKNRVLQLYTRVETTKELTALLNMSPSDFKRKFYKTFGTSAKQWMIQKKKEKLLRDIMMTDLTVAELADKYKYTANYLTTFCKEHFGKSPTELRAEKIVI